jgi:hypothetical protein
MDIHHLSGSATGFHLSSGVHQRSSVWEHEVIDLRKIGVLASAMAVALGVGLATATTASANAVNVNLNAFATPATLAVSPSVVAAGVGDVISFSYGVSGPGGFLTIANGSGAVSSSGTPCTGSACQMAPSSTLNLTVTTTGTLSLSASGSNVTLTIGSGGGSSDASSPAPQTFELSLNPQDGTSCTNSSESGTAGTWITLPGASDCTRPASKPGAILLGWATSPNFPVDIAKRQVDNGWGAYEIFNDEGQLTAVFIPAGGATLLSGPGKLYTIWSE